MNELVKLMKHFGYGSLDWLRLKVISHSSLIKQFAEYEMSDVKNKEHYRCRAFSEYLTHVAEISDETLIRLLRLSDNGSDGWDLSLNRALNLAKCGVLTDDQLEFVRNRSDFRELNGFQATVERILIERRLNDQGLTDDLFRRICELNTNAAIQLLLDSDDLRRHHLVWIAEFGCNKRLRNIAAQTLQQPKFRDGG